MIKIEDLRFAYPGQDEALRGVSLEVAEGLTLGLVGANGSGKSTLLSIMAGLHRPTGGSLTLGGCKTPGQEKKLRGLTGLVMQDADLQIIGSTVAEDLALAEPGGGLDLSGELRRTAALYGLDGLLDRAVHELSWGQKKRLCLAATLHARPSVLLLDEPFAGLDYPGICQMRRSLADNRAEGLTQVITAHDIEPMADLVDLWAVLRQGRLMLLGQASEVFDGLLANDVRPPCSWLAGQGVRPWS